MDPERFQGGYSEGGYSEGGYSEGGYSEGGYASLLPSQPVSGGGQRYGHGCGQGQG